MKTGSTFAILLGGALSVDERVRALVAGASAIAADSGIRHADPLGLTPELWVGDFDSTPDGEAEKWPDIPKLAFPAAKNATDGEIAIDEALARGATRLILIGALQGERSDHAALHFLQALALAERGIEVILGSGEEEAVPLIAGNVTLDLPKGSLFSILPYAPLEGLSIAGVRYPLDDASIDFASSRTMSNVADSRVSISLGSGRAIVLMRPHDYSGN